MANVVSVGLTAGAPAFPLGLPLGLPALFFAPFSGVLRDFGDFGSAAAAAEDPSVHPPGPSWLILQFAPYLQACLAQKPQGFLPPAGEATRALPPRPGDFDPVRRGDLEPCLVFEPDRLPLMPQISWL